MQKSSSAKEKKTEMEMEKEEEEVRGQEMGAKGEAMMCEGVEGVGRRCSKVGLLRQLLRQLLPPLLHVLQQQAQALLQLQARVAPVQVTLRCKASLRMPRASLRILNRILALCAASQATRRMNAGPPKEASAIRVILRDTGPSTALQRRPIAPWW